MMKFRFKKIPRLAIIFYALGFCLILIAMADLFIIPHFFISGFLTPLVTQQIFIAGAIIVALGSVINNLYHFL